MVHLRVYPRAPYVVNMSPFCIKLETWLRLAKVPYDVETTGKTSSKGKSPWILYNGHAIGDSSLIVQFLQTEFNVTLDAHLTPTEHAVGRAFQVHSRARGAGRS